MFHHTGMCRVLDKGMLIRVWLALCEEKTTRRVHVLLYIEFLCMQTFRYESGVCCLSPRLLEPTHVINVVNVVA